jgi:hypothetical protein
VRYRYRLIVRAALLALVLWCGLVVGWALVLRRIAQSVSNWDELEEDEVADDRSPLPTP